MAKTHELFQSFNNAIKISEAKESEIKASRDAIRASVKKWMEENGHGSISFFMQGSMAMCTAVNPIGNCEYDLDDGVYLKKYEDDARDVWPTCETAHRWIRNAVANQTTNSPIDKNTCVRVPYEHGYHMDVPIYILKNGTAYLAHKRDGWIHSDAKEFKDWLTDKSDGSSGQLRRIIRYLKRWKDENDVDLKGIEITILAAYNYEHTAGDDDALRYVIGNIIDTLERSFSCVKPVAPGDDLFAERSHAQKDCILSALRKLNEVLEDAHFEDDELLASELLRKEFGSDFPKGESTCGSASVATTSAPGVLVRDGRSG